MKLPRVFLLTGITFLIGIVPSFSQTDTLKNEFGFGTNILFHNLLNSTSTPFDFYYRRHSGNALWRFGGSFALRSDQDIRDFSSSYNGVWDIEIIVGKEWRTSLASRWQLNFGGDFTTGFGHSEEERRSREPEGNNRSYSYRKSQKYQAGLRPFIGLMFKLNDRLGLSTEASFRAVAQRWYYKEHGWSLYNERMKINSYPGNGASWKLYFNSSPASNIFVYYRF